MNNSVERPSPTPLHCLFRVSVGHYKFMRHQLFYALRSRCPALLPPKKPIIFLAVSKRMLTTKYSTSIRLACKRKVSCTDIQVSNLHLIRNLWQSPRDNLSTPCRGAWHSSAHPVDRHFAPAWSWGRFLRAHPKAASVYCVCLMPYLYV